MVHFAKIALNFRFHRLFCYFAFCCERNSGDVGHNRSLSTVDQLYPSPSLRTASTTLRQTTTTMATSTTPQNKLDAVSDVDIDDAGKFKYILLKVHWTKNTVSETSKYIVRGYAWAGYHVDIYDDVDSKLHKMGLEGECVGGGRIVHEPQKKTILVYGYSQGYGRADHSIAVELLKKRYPNYDSITWSNEGY